MDWIVELLLAWCAVSVVLAAILSVILRRLN